MFACKIVRLFQLNTSGNKCWSLVCTSIITKLIIMYILLTTSLTNSNTMIRNIFNTHSTQITAPSYTTRRNRNRTIILLVRRASNILHITLHIQLLTNIMLLHTRNTLLSSCQLILLYLQLHSTLLKLQHTLLKSQPTFLSFKLHKMQLLFTLTRCQIQLILLFLRQLLLLLHLLNIQLQLSLIIHILLTILQLLLTNLLVVQSLQKPFKNLIILLTTISIQIILFHILLLNLTHVWVHVRCIVFNMGST